MLKTAIIFTLENHAYEKVTNKIQIYRVLELTNGCQLEHGRIVKKSRVKLSGIINLECSFYGAAIIHVNFIAPKKT